MYGAMAMGEANSFTPNYAKAKMSASHILMLINRVPDIDNDSEEGEKPVQFSFPLFLSLLKIKSTTFEKRILETVACSDTLFCLFLFN